MSRLGWDSPFSSSSSPQSRLRGESYNQELIENKENVNDEKVPIMDSKRFTPNLHASLVSEILSLRREIEAKNNTLTGLEESLSNSKIDNGRLKATVTGQEQEVRSAKKQMQLLESGTLAALGDLAKERDRAIENLAETRKRLETSRETIRVREADASRSQAIWEKDKQSWDNEKRNLERKVHVAEGRLKVMVAEVAAIQASTQPAPGSDHEEGVGETWFSNWSDIISTRSSSVRGRHHLSEMSNKTYDTDELANLRASIVAPSAEIEGTPSNPLTLAEELNFDEADDDDHARGHEPDDEEKMSPTALSEEDSLLPSRLSIQFQDKKARRVLGLPMDRTDMHVFEPPAVEGNSLTLRDKLAVRQRKITSYHDSATQFTPPSSPTFSALDLEALAEKDSLKAPSVENTANQSRKRVSAVAMPQEQICLPKIDLQAGQQTASVACQTIPQPISPPLVPIVALEPLFPEPSTLFAPEMKPACTQTDNNMMATSESASTRKHSTMAIPIIAIHPPGSRPNSSHTNVVLPPHTKNVACQTSSEPLFQMRSVAVQTGEIRIDKRPLKIPPRTMSVATPSKPGSQNGQSYRAAASQMTRTNLKNPPPVEPFRPRQRPSNIRTHGSFPGRDDDRSINHSQLADSRHPVKHESLFAGFSDQEGPEDNVISDDDDFANVAPIRKTLSKVQNSWKLVPAPMDPDLGPRELGRPISDIQELDDTSEACAHEMQVAVAKQVMASSANQPKADQKFSVSSRLLKHPNIRKATLISSGAVAHTRKRSPSEPGPSMETTSAPPPFPVPTRSSSRKIPLSSSEGALSPTPYKTSFITGSRDRPPIRPPSKNPLRKVRSAAAVPKFARSITRQEDLQSPTTASPTSTPLDSPRLPLTSRGDGATQHINVTLEQSVPEPSIESPSQTTSVVDAIAQTMVGEWMWKYVRKRKSFGITDPPQVEFEEGRNSGESGSGIRHKRWVWLAPYERAVLWSSKQPTNGSALLGKAGRKLVIRSVLDVRDDTPMPKNSGNKPPFSRSILILTPQRALKFTATTRDRHYIWLTALSFLCHSTLGMDDLATTPPVPQQEYHALSQGIGSGARRSPRDSIRVAKSKERPVLSHRNYTSPIMNPPGHAVLEACGYDGSTDRVLDAAEPPQIPRLSAHTRKRSNTGPRPSLQSAFSSFPANKGIPPTHTRRIAMSQEASTSVTQGSHGYNSGPPTMAGHMSESACEAGHSDYLDAIGTVRMEAFVDRTTREVSKGTSLPRGSYRTRQGRKKDLSYWGMAEGGDQFDVGAVSGSRPKWGEEDPFKGF